MRPRYGAFETLLERMHRVHTLARRTRPLDSRILIFCRFGRDTFLVRLCAWLTLYPLNGFLPQISQTRDMENTLLIPIWSVGFWLSWTCSSIPRDKLLNQIPMRKLPHDQFVE